MKTMTFWRLVKTRYADNAFDGYGARTYGGRWNSPGHECVYLSSTKALCVLEILVHLEMEDVSRGYSFLTIDIPVTRIATLDLTMLPADWQADPAPFSTQKIGDDWLASSQNGLLLRVPSTITGEWNAIFNPNHPDAAPILETVKKEPFIIDPRLYRSD